jgi:hypothetical protein
MAACDPASSAGKCSRVGFQLGMLQDVGFAAKNICQGQFAVVLVFLFHPGYMFNADCGRSIRHGHPQLDYCGGFLVKRLIFRVHRISRRQPHDCLTLFSARGRPAGLRGSCRRQHDKNTEHSITHFPASQQARVEHCAPVL